MFDNPKKDELTIRVVGPELAGIQVSIKRDASHAEIDRYRDMIFKHIEDRFEEIEKK